MDQKSCCVNPATEWKPPAPSSGLEKVSTIDCLQEPGNTSEYYQTKKNLPERFNKPRLFSGYGCQKPQHPLYRTTTSDIGRYPPSVHTMPTCFYGKNMDFSKHLAKAGMYRYDGLNTEMDKTRC